MRQCIMPGCNNSVTTYGRIVCDQCFEKGELAMFDKFEERWSEKKRKVWSDILDRLDTQKREQAAKMPAYPRD
ncbi:MAG: hypothetical protein M0Q91_15155 [Methanoregula sp.]|nr:hypothetical protein [Methanoregula sp.]